MVQRIMVSLPSSVVSILRIPTLHALGFIQIWHSVSHHTHGYSWFQYKTVVLKEKVCQQNNAYYHMSDSHKCMGDNGEGSLAAARSLQKAVFFTASHARIHISTTSHMRIRISTRIRYCKSHALRLSMQ